MPPGRLRVITLLSLCIGIVGITTQPRNTQAESLEQLEEELASHQRPARLLLESLGEHLLGSEQKQAQNLLQSIVRSRIQQLAKKNAPYTDREIDDLIQLIELVPHRFESDSVFRDRILETIPGALPDPAPQKLRDRLLVELNLIEGIDFEHLEAIEAGWGVVARRSLVQKGDHLGLETIFAAETEGELRVSVYSLPSAFVAPEEARSFLAGVREIAPKRRLLVLSDMSAATIGADLDIDILPTHGRPYSPWPRDPFSIVRIREDRVRILMRPNLQPGRKTDATLGLELIQQLPADLDAAWKGSSWAVAPVPFHNGQILVGKEAVWISLHSIEIRILEILDLSKVPAESFSSLEGANRYLAAGRRAAEELEELYHRPVRFVHGMEVGSDHEADMRILGGGGGFDLDSLVTLLPDRNGKPHFLVADLTLGAKVLAEIPMSEWTAFADFLDLRLPAEAVRGVLRAALDSGRPRRLASYLDQVVEHFARSDMTVTRLPILVVPTGLLTETFSHPEFLINWNNVVLEETPRGLRAEGFSSLLPTADREVRRIFRSAGVKLDLVPPLLRSVILNGGYRCASNHLRASSTEELAH